jgi:hypothetical protein
MTEKTSQEYGGELMRLLSQAQTLVTCIALARDREMKDAYTAGERDMAARIIEAAMAASKAGEPVPEVRGGVTDVDDEFELEDVLESFTVDAEIADAPPAEAVTEMERAFIQTECDKPPAAVESEWVDVLPERRPVTADDILETFPLVVAPPAGLPAGIRACEAQAEAMTKMAEGYIGAADGNDAPRSRTEANIAARLAPIWTDEEDEKLRDMPNWKPGSKAEVEAAMPGRIHGACYTRCLQVLKCIPPTVGQMNIWAAERFAASHAGHTAKIEEAVAVRAAAQTRVTVDDVINTLRRAGDTAYCSDAPLFTLFEVNQCSRNRAELLAKANKYRARASLAPWTDDQVAWFRPLAAAPAKAKPPFTRYNRP